MSASGEAATTSGRAATEAAEATPASGVGSLHAAIEVGERVAGLEVDELIARYGSPLYVYDADAIVRRVEALRGALPASVDVAFATKANPSPAVLELLAAAGLGADVASGGELRAVLRAGFAPDRIVFTGPGKTDAELEAALRTGIGGLTMESLDELDALLELVGASPGLVRQGQGLLLRLATVGDGETTPIISGDGSAKFGLTDEEATEAVARLADRRALGPVGPLRLRGFHAFGASNVLTADVLVDGARDLAVRAERIAAAQGLVVELLDAGGGLGIPYTERDPVLDLAALGRGLAAELATWARRPPLSGARLLLEPGRWLVGPAGAYLCTVVRTKSRGGRGIAITDGGIHHLLRPRLVGQDHRIVAVGDAARRPHGASVDVVGPLCTGLDVLATAIRAPMPERGDRYAVLDAGAYGYTESMPGFLSHPSPAEVVVRQGEAIVSRERREPK